jgi:hypothetical protein
MRTLTVGIPKNDPSTAVMQLSLRAHAVSDLRGADDRAVLEVTLAHQRALKKAPTAVDGSSQILVRSALGVQLRHTPA